MDDERVHGVSLREHAELSAHLAEGRQPLHEILAARNLSEQSWFDATLHWMRHLAEDGRVDGLAVAAYSEAFSAAQDALAAVPEMSIEEWAALSKVAEDSDPATAIASYRLAMGDWFRLTRVWMKRLAEDPALRARYDAARTNL